MTGEGEREREREGERVNLRGGRERVRTWLTDLDLYKEHRVLWPAT